MSTKIERLTQKVADAKTTAAIGAEFAEDYIIIKGVKFYHQTVSHAWVIPMVAARLGDELSIFDKGYLLSPAKRFARLYSTISVLKPSMGTIPRRNRFTSPYCARAFSALLLISLKSAWS